VRCQAFADAGGKISNNATQAVANADCVVCVVVSSAQTEALLFGDPAVATTMPQDSVFISCATVPPAFAVKAAERLEAGGRLYLDAPTSGGAAKATSGEITIMGSGTPAAFERARPVLDATASKVYRLGDKAGAGSAMKLINQLLAGVHIASACEAMALAIKLGLDANTVYDVITNAAGSSWMFENRVPHILEGDYQPKSAINIFTKDLGIVLDTARTENFPVPLAGSALQMFLMAAAAGMGNDDDASVTRVYAQLAGLELPQAKTPANPTKPGA
jgi:3-hydroxyisobutyrate dehydrogenase